MVLLEIMKVDTFKTIFTTCLGNKLCRGAHKSSRIKFVVNLPFNPIISNGKVFYPLCNMYDQLIEQNRPLTPNDFKIIDSQCKLLKFE